MGRCSKKKCKQLRCSLEHPLFSGNKFMTKTIFCLNRCTKCQQKTNVNQKQMSTKNKCQPKTNVNPKKCQPKKNVNQKTNVNRKQMSTKNKCQPKTNVLYPRHEIFHNVTPKTMSQKIIISRC